MRHIVIFSSIWLCLHIMNVPLALASAVNYTGQSCTANSATALANCGNSPSFFTLGDSSAWNSTHAFFFRGETADIGCCVSPPSNVSSDITLTLSQRVIAYMLHKSGQNVFPFSTGGQLCWHSSSGVDLCQANSNLQAAKSRMSSNNGMCEYMKLTISGITYDEMGTWKCMSDINSANQAERSVIVGDRGTLSCNKSRLGDSISSGDQVIINCSLSGYSPTGARIELRVGKDLQNMENIVSENSYLSSLVTVKNLSIRRAENEQSCTDSTSIYEQSASVTYPIHRCQYTTPSWLTLVMNDGCKTGVKVQLTVTAYVGGRQSENTTISFMCLSLPISRANKNTSVDVGLLLSSLLLLAGKLSIFNFS